MVETSWDKIIHGRRISRRRRLSLEEHVFDEEIPGCPAVENGSYHNSRVFSRSLLRVGLLPVLVY